ncbi:MAG: hypothetical protein GX607_03780 [Myxococcales bacterium]|jgi:hypothetical protein|nr:hypothetical protein [Myxococcales bacterium]
MFPAGRASGAPGDHLATRYSWQVPLTVDLGYKPIPQLYLGAYFGFSLGAEGNQAQVESWCVDDDNDLENDIACSSHTLRAGLAVQYHLAPGAHWNPWVGYGIGVEAASQSISDRPRGRSESTTSRGVTFAALSAGADLRHVLGFGPYGQVAIGRFNSTRTEINDVERFDGSIDDRALHYWLELGLRMVLRP